MRRLVIALCGLVTFASACADDHPAQTFSGKVEIAIAAPSLNVVAGSNATTLVTISRLGDYTGSVTLSATGLPAGVTVTFLPLSVPPSSISSTLTFAVAGSVPAGSTVLTVHAAGMNTADATAQIQLNVSH